MTPCPTCKNYGRAHLITCQWFKAPTQDRTPSSEELLARLFHDTYERLAPDYGYETRDDTKDFDPNTANGKLMVAVAKVIIDEHTAMAVLAARIDELETFQTKRDIFNGNAIRYIKDRITELKSQGDK